MRIVSLLPSATEILFALGFDREVVGVSHECDFPPQARSKRVVIHSRIPDDTAPAEIDRLVREFVSRGESLYAVDAQALEELAPDLIITQDLCHVCAASPDDLGAALARGELDRGTPRGKLPDALFRHLLAARPFGLRSYKVEASQWATWGERWSAAALDRALRLALATDLALKTTGVSDEAGVMRQLILSLAVPAREAA